MNAFSRLALAALRLSILSAGVVAATAPAAAAQARPGQSGQANASLRMVQPHKVVLGEDFEVALRIPPISEEDGDPSLQLLWYAAGTPLRNWEGPVNRTQRTPTVLYGDHASPVPVTIPRAKAPPATVPVIAPYERTGTYELRLLQSTGSSWLGKLLGIMQVEVVEGRVTDALTLTDKVSVFAPGAPIGLKVKLPANRFYQGLGTGPNIAILPYSGDLKVAPEVAHQWLSSTWGCTRTCTSLRGQVWIAKSESPHGAGVASRTGKFIDVRPGMKEEGIDQEPLFAPTVPGKYEIRLYDRGFSTPADTYVELHLQKVIIDVEDPGSTPKLLRFMRLKPPVPANASATPRSRGNGASQPAVLPPTPRAGNTLDDYEEVPDLVDKERYPVVAEFEPVADTPEPPTRTARIQWVVRNSGGRLESRERVITLLRKGPNLYVSDPVEVVVEDFVSDRSLAVIKEGGK